MPSRRVHLWDAKRRRYSPRVNFVIDLPWVWLGNKHRILFHDPLSAMAIGQIIDGPQGAIGALSHLALDGIKDKEAREFLELMARMNVGVPKRKVRIRVLPSP